MVKSAVVEEWTPLKSENALNQSLTYCFVDYGLKKAMEKNVNNLDENFKSVSCL